MCTVAAVTTGTRDRILDAAEACLRRDGIRRTTVAAVADEAGISRAYVYRFFADKPTLVSAALIRRDEVDQLFDPAEQRRLEVGVGADP